MFQKLEPLRCWLLLLCALWLGSCGAKTTEARPLSLLAAASTADWVAELTREFPGGPVQASFGASSDLARQIADGLPADVFISASPKWVDFLEQGGLLSGPRRLVARNRLVVVANAALALPAGDSKDAVELLDALAPDAVIAIANEGVPAGDYARAALASLGLSARYAPRLVGFADVRAVLRAVASGEAAVGFVYQSDARLPGVRPLFAFEASTHPQIEYVAAVVAPAERRRMAEEFVDCLGSAAARAKLVELGFELDP